MKPDGVHERIKARLEELRSKHIHPWSEISVEQVNVLLDRTRDWVDHRCPKCEDSGIWPIKCDCNRPALLEETLRRLE